MAEVVVGSEEVLAYMAATGCGPTEAARHFGVPTGTVKAWHHRARKRAAATGDAPPQPQLRNPRRDGARTPAELHMLPPPKQQLPPELKSRALAAVEVRLTRLAGPVDAKEESPADSAKIVGQLLDRFALFGELDKGAAPAEEMPDLATPEGEAALVERMAKLPAHLLEAARRKQAG